MYIVFSFCICIGFKRICSGLGGWNVWTETRGVVFLRQFSWYRLGLLGYFKWYLAMSSEV